MAKMEIMGTLYLGSRRFMRILNGSLLDQNKSLLRPSSNIQELAVWIEDLFLLLPVIAIIAVSLIGSNIFDKFSFKIVNDDSKNFRLRAF